LVPDARARLREVRGVKYKLRDWTPMPPGLLVPKVSYGAGPEAVYILECWTPGAYYVGISKELEKRLRRHWDDTFIDTREAVKVEPNVIFMTTHGYRATLAVIRVPTRAEAKELECAWTYKLAGSAYVVFGCGIESTCPGTKWLNGFGGRAWWDRNTVRFQEPATAAGHVEVAGSLLALKAEAPANSRN
jgi:predicted GIY-YIG superfamily endonuclease